MTEKGPIHRFAIGVSRGAGAALIFSLPILMTMEMWSLGFYMPRARMALLLLMLMPLLVGLSYYSGFEDVSSVAGHVSDVFVAYLIGVLTAIAILLLLGIVTTTTPFGEALGKITLQAIPASIGAMLARTQFGGEQPGEAERREPGYFGELFLMTIGALFLAFNIAPTEEVLLLAYHMTPWNAIGIALLCLAVLHTFVFSLEFSGSHPVPEAGGHGGVFLRFALPGLVIAMLISAYVLWSFGRFDGLSAHAIIMATSVLALPASVGAAAARLIL